ncbi:hypothetical protein [Flexibacterium corallicola]|uniref:hypothetical protein n=1 Tax=Flexibacterium corallicola TaxID=3037259 RepID=UPI00286EFC3E|nr:hypothetical protein [Pseudovibrio sp. M1P-2-3]
MRSISLSKPNDKRTCHEIYLKWQVNKQLALYEALQGLNGRGITHTPQASLFGRLEAVEKCILHKPYASFLQKRLANRQKYRKASRTTG